MGLDEMIKHENKIIRYLADPFTPLFTHIELKDHTIRFIQHLKKNRKALIRYGYIEPLFDGSLWFENFTYNLFLTKNLDHAELKETPSEIISKIKELREDFFDLRLAILDGFLLVLSGEKGSGGLWKSCIEAITNKISISDLRYFLSLEMIGRNEPRGYYEKTAMLGGIFNLLLMISRYRMELKCGTFARIKNRISTTPKPFFGENAHAVVDLRDKLIENYRQYFQGKGTTVERFLTDVVLLFAKLTGAEREFWVDRRDHLVKPLTRLGQFALIDGFLQTLNENPRKRQSCGHIRRFFKTDYDLYVKRISRNIHPLSGPRLGWVEENGDSDNPSGRKLRETIFRKHIRHSRDFSRIWCRDEFFVFSDHAVPVLRKLMVNYFTGNKPVSQSLLIERHGSKPEHKRVKDVFKSTPHWENLIQATQAKDGKFSLKLPLSTS